MFLVVSLRRSQSLFNEIHVSLGRPDAGWRLLLQRSIIISQFGYNLSRRTTSDGGCDGIARYRRTASQPRGPGFESAYRYTSSSIKALLLALFVVAQSVAAAARLGRATAARSQVSLQRWFYALRSFFVTLRASFRSSSHRPGEEESGDDIRDADYFRSANRGRARPVLERERRDLGGGHERDGDAPALKRKPTFFACVPRLPRGTKSCG
jgi:hypothetical protein